MPESAGTMVWIVVVIAIIIAVFALFKWGFPRVGSRIMSIMTGQLDSTDNTAKKAQEGGIPDGLSKKVKDSLGGDDDTGSGKK